MRFLMSIPVSIWSFLGRRRGALTNNAVGRLNDSSGAAAAVFGDDSFDMSSACWISCMAGLVILAAGSRYCEGRLVVCGPKYLYIQKWAP